MKSFKLVALTLIVGILSIGNFSFAGNPFVRNLLGTQLEIGINQRSNFGVLRNGQEGDSLSIQQEIYYRANYDLVAELDKCKTEQERLNVLEQYIISLKNTVSQGNTMFDYEKSQVDYYNKIANECEAPIKGKNVEFTEAIKNNNYQKAEAISKEVAELRACVAENQVYARAHSSYASSANSLNSLQKKADYLSTNKEKIAKYYEILKSDLLKELLDISKTVENNF